MQQPLLPDPTVAGEGRQSVSLPVLSPEGLRTAALEAGYKQIPGPDFLYKTFARQVHFEVLKSSTSWGVTLLRHVGEDKLYGLGNLERLRSAVADWRGDLHDAYLALDLDGTRENWEELVPVSDAVRRLVAWGAANLEGELDAMLAADPGTDLMQAPVLVLRQIGLEWSGNAGGITIGAFENVESAVRRLRIVLRAASPELDLLTEDVVPFLRSSDPDDQEFGYAHVGYVSGSNGVPRDVVLELLRDDDPRVRAAGLLAVPARFAPEEQPAEGPVGEGRGPCAGTL